MIDLRQPLLTEADAAKLLGVTCSQMVTWRRQETGPEWLCIGKRVIRYEPAALTTWVLERSRSAWDRSSKS